MTTTNVPSSPGQVTAATTATLAVEGVTVSDLGDDQVLVGFNSPTGAVSLSGPTSLIYGLVIEADRQLAGIVRPSGGDR